MKSSRERTDANEGNRRDRLGAILRRAISKLAGRVSAPATEVAAGSERTTVIAPGLYCGGARQFRCKHRSESGLFVSKAKLAA